MIAMLPAGLAGDSETGAPRVSITGFCPPAHIARMTLPDLTSAVPGWMVTGERGQAGGRRR